MALTLLNIRYGGRGHALSDPDTCHTEPRPLTSPEVITSILPGDERPQALRAMLRENWRKQGRSGELQDIRPRFQFGYINPVLVSDFIHYQFYRLFPPDALLVTYHLALNSFSTEGVEASMVSFWDAVDFLASRQVQRMSLGGVPLSAFLGRPKVLEITAQANARTPVPFTTDFEDSVDAIRALGLRKVAVAAKWDQTLLRAVDTYLHDAGVETAGTYGAAHTAQQVVALRPEESVEVALSLGREAMARMKDADGLFLAGGAWLVQQAVVELEAELGVPVVTNPGATYWSALRSQGLHGPADGAGMLIDSLRQGG